MDSVSILDATTTENAFAPQEEAALERCQEATALAGQLTRSAVQKLVDYLGDEHPFVRWQAGVSLADTAARLKRRARAGWPTGSRQSPELTYSGLLLLLRQGLMGPDPVRRAATADALALWDHEVVVNILTQALRDSEPVVRVSAAGALARVRDKAAVGILVTTLSDTSAWVRRAAAEALGAIGEADAVPALYTALGDTQSLVRASAACALAHFQHPKARSGLEQALQDQDAAVRWYAVRGLERIGNLGSLAALQSVLTDQHTLFERTTADLASAAIKSIKRRESGLWSTLVRAFYALRDVLRRTAALQRAGEALRRFSQALGRQAARGGAWLGRRISTWSPIVAASRAAQRAGTGLAQRGRRAYETLRARLERRA